MCAGGVRGVVAGVMVGMGLHEPCYLKEWGEDGKEEIEGIERAGRR